MCRSSATVGMISALITKFGGSTPTTLMAGRGRPVCCVIALLQRMLRASEKSARPAERAGFEPLTMELGIHTNDRATHGRPNGHQDNTRPHQ